MKKGTTAQEAALHSIVPITSDGVSVLLQLRGTGAHAIMMNQCANVTLNGLTMHNVGMFWIIDWAGTGNTVRVVPSLPCLGHCSLFLE